MDSKEFNSGAGAPATKPWLNPVVNTLEAVSILAESLEVNGRITQEKEAGGHLTPYSLWRCLGDFEIAGTTLVFAMGSYIGPAFIPAASCYDGMAVNIKVGGRMTTTGANTTTFSIRDLAGTYVHSSITFSTAGAVAGIAVALDFCIQIDAIGGAGVGIQRSFTTITANGVSLTPVVATARDATTFSTLAGVAYFLYVQNSTAPSAPRFDRELAYAVLEA